MSQKRKRSPGASEDGDTQQPSVFRSEPIEDRSSTFVGLFSPSLKPKELQVLKEIASASHKMFAWRRESNQQSITGGMKYTTDHDDDGEKYGGKQIAQVLNRMNVKGVCVVARWYGGVMLGPIRFDHMEKCATEAVKKWQESVNEGRAKKRKADEDAVTKVKLVKVLADRDESISVLRTLAAEKEAKVKSGKAEPTSQETPGETASNANGATSQQAETSSPAAKASIDYWQMTLERLKMLEKARDATLSFLLKRIDKAEAALISTEDKG